MCADNVCLPEKCRYLWHCCSSKHWLNIYKAVITGQQLRTRPVTTDSKDLVLLASYSHRRSLGIFEAGGATISFCQNLILFCQKNNILSWEGKFSNSVLPSWCTMLLCHTDLPVLTLGKNCWTMARKLTKMEENGIIQTNLEEKQAKYGGYREC